MSLDSNEWLAGVFIHEREYRDGTGNVTGTSSFNQTLCNFDNNYENGKKRIVLTYRLVITYVRAGNQPLGVSRQPVEICM